MEAGVTPDSRRYQRAQVIFFCCITAGGGALVAGGGWWVVGWPATTVHSNNCLIWNDDELLKLSWYLFESSGNILGHPCFQWTCTYTTNWYLGLLWTLVTYVIRFLHLHLIWSDMRQTFSACTEWKEGWRSGENMVFCFYGTEFWLGSSEYPI